MGAEIIVWPKWVKGKQCMSTQVSAKQQKRHADFDDKYPAVLSFTRRPPHLLPLLLIILQMAIPRSAGRTRALSRTRSAWTLWRGWGGVGGGGGWWIGRSLTLFSAVCAAAVAKGTTSLSNSALLFQLPYFPWLWVPGRSAAEGVGGRVATFLKSRV